MSRPPPAQSNGQRYHIHTFGCQMNLADSERIAGALDAEGYSCATDASDANVLIYNTCSIRDKAEQKVYSALGRQVHRVAYLHASATAHTYHASNKVSSASVPGQPCPLCSFLQKSACRPAANGKFAPQPCVSGLIKNASS